MAIEKATFHSTDGHRLEGRLAMPEQPAGAAVICHAHPLYGGSMSNAPITSIQRALLSAGWASLRFNFRGVRLSEGIYGGGIQEVRDVSGALEHLAQLLPGKPLAVTGWSFGSLVGLSAATTDPRVDAYVACAPPVSTCPRMDLPELPPPERLAAWRARVMAICGDHDRFCKPDDLQRWAHDVSAGAIVKVIEGTDHYFADALDELAKSVATFIAEDPWHSSTDR
jgi:alpha/beta superfamily hydrolase